MVNVKEILCAISRKNCSDTEYAVRAKDSDARRILSYPKIGWRHGTATRGERKYPWQPS